MEFVNKMINLTENNIDLSNLKKVSSVKFLIFSALTFNIYQYFWLILRFKTLNKISKSKYNSISLQILLLFGLFFYVVICLQIVSILVPILSGEQISDIIELNTVLLYFSVALYTIELIISFKIIKIIEEYALIENKKIIRHNIVWLVLLKFIYVNFALNCFSKRLNESEVIDEILSVTK